MGVLPLYMSAYHMPGAYKGQKKIRFPRMEVTDGCELSCMYWVSNLGPLEKKQVILTTESSFQLPYILQLLESNQSHLSRNLILS